MPKPHQRPNRHSGGDRDFYEHDYRSGDRRVTFKHGNRQGGKFKNKDWSQAVRSHFEDEDMDMNIPSVGTGKTFRKGKRGKGGRNGSPMPFEARKLLQGTSGSSGWFKISIPYGDKYDKSFLMKFLVDALAPLPFWPISWHTNGNKVEFYVDEKKVAEKLLSLDKQVQMPNGFKLIVKVYPASPNVEMTPELKEKIKLVMAKRYNADNKALDLSKFHADPDLQESFCALFKPVVFLAVLNIMEENIANLEALSLNDNKLFGFGFIKNIQRKLPNIKILHLANNKIRDLMQLDPFNGLPVEDLMLDGNPLCNKYKEQNAYISEVRKRFPKCLKLDGIQLPPPISFDVAEESNLPLRQQTFLCNSEGEGIVRQFLEQYFNIFDSKNRQPLLQAYHENAMFSFTMAYPYGLGKDKNVSWLNWYQTENRNIRQVKDTERRFKLLKQGQLSVVSFLQEMPETKHDIHSFTVDLTIFTPQMISLTVSGMFKELKTSHKFPPTRFFFKTLVITPAGNGFCIVNEVYHISNATPQQAKEAFKTPSLPTPAPGTAAPPSTPEASPIIHTTAPVMDNNAKQEMVNQIAVKTGMNVEWSIKCLEGNEWNFMKAYAVFEDLQSKGAIPPEAYIK